MYAGLFLFSLLWSLSLTLQSCASSKFVERQRSKKIKRMIARDAILKDALFGFYLYDPDEEEDLITLRVHKRFTPASNTKLMSYYVSRRALGDSFPVVQYLDRDTVRYIKGCGYPLLPDSRFIELLRGKEYIVDCTDSLTRYGAGWAWDDYPYYYQKELDMLPLEGSALKLAFDGRRMHWSPGLPELKVRRDTSLRGRYDRAEFANVFKYNPEYFLHPDTVEIPIYDTQHLRAALLHRWATLGNGDCPVDWTGAKVMRYEMVDSVFIRLLHLSDNFIAEQLLLMSAFEQLDTISTRRIIAWAMDSVLVEMPDKIRWVDGSGLSRYNLNTPANFVWIIRRILSTEGIRRIERVFPAAGSSGTLANAYASLRTASGQPFVFAKSGSLSNNYCLSGLIKTHHGRRLIFSFMGNHFIQDHQKIKAHLEEILRTIHREL